MTRKKPIIELQHVAFRYEADEGPVVTDVSLAIRPGEWVAITGHSGSGKSTIAQLLSGYLPRAGGGVRDGVLLVDGLDPAEASIAEVVQRIGAVFQDPDAQLVQGRVEDEVAFGPENLRFDVPAIEQRVTDALAAVDLTERRYDSVHALSGGQRQRTAIAAVLALAPPVLVFDEPVASLDVNSRRRFLALLRQLHREGRTLITVSGRLDELAQAAPRLIVMEGGKVMIDGPTDELISRKWAHLVELGVLPGQSLPPPCTESLAQRHVKISEASQASQASHTAEEHLPGAAYVEEGSLSMGPAKIGKRLRGSGREPLLQIQGLSFAYGKAGPTVLQDVNLTLNVGEWRLLCGENGSGKTTLSRLLMGLLSPPRGTIWWQGQDVAKLTLYELAGDIGYVFQQPEHQFVAATVWEELIYGPRFQMRLRPGDALPQEIIERAEELLQSIGLSERGEVSPYLLSGGEKRLLSAAAAMMVPKKLYILDEPTAGADYRGTRALAALCRRAVREGASVIMITHEPECFAGEPLTIWMMDQGRLQL
ncbi:ABC transporter ATP-binding protein [Paenibacillus lentus]|uniref:ABC transporter ATP-binding protein n=1 Tax=Paenibacillus lentus TaxID=1338368 RepID=UPI001FE7B871|nr:energy-coupling factor transporter ATPase [Paenibacillus lentus]